MGITNPHYSEPVESGQFCWRVDGFDYWSKTLYTDESKAIESAKAFCKEKLGVGKYTIHLGITDTQPVDCRNLVERYRQHLSYGWEHKELFGAMGLPKSLWKQTSSQIALAVESELVKAAQNSRRTTINKVKHTFFTVKPDDMGIAAKSLSDLVSELRNEYSRYSTDWVKVSSLQTLLEKASVELFEQHELPFSIQRMRIWQGYERTKDRLHVVCEEPFNDGRFHRVSNETLCTKQPVIDTSDYNEPVPCLACLDRLAKIEAKL